MIAPHTTIPTVHAAIQEPCHMVTTTFACLVTGAGMPIRVNALDWQPAVASSKPAAMAARGSQRRARRTRLASGPLPLPPALLGALRFRLTCGLPGGGDSGSTGPAVARPTACRGNSIAQPCGVAGSPRRNWARPLRGDSLRPALVRPRAVARHYDRALAVIRRYPRHR